MKITLEHFKAVFGNISPYLSAKIDSCALEVAEVPAEERDKHILDMIRAVYHDNLPISGPSRKQTWEKGWAENLAGYGLEQTGLAATIPRYFKKHPVIRWQGNLYSPKSPNYEYNIHSIVCAWAFDKYLRGYDHIYEFGCGTGNNLFHIREVCPYARLVALDWVESGLRLINRQTSDGAYDPGPVTTELFDFYSPNYGLCVPPEGVAFLTVNSMEQIGYKWEPFLNFILTKNPSICIHIEPINEVLSPDVLLDHLGRGYSEKRGYLGGYLTHLDHNPLVEMIEVLRPRVGAKFVETFTVVVWRPKP